MGKRRGHNEEIERDQGVGANIDMASIKEKISATFQSEDLSKRWISPGCMESRLQDVGIHQYKKSYEVVSLSIHRQ